MPPASDSPASSPGIRSRRTLERIYAIHREISKGDFPNCRAMAERLGVTQKTIQRDINFMRCDLELPLEYDSTEYGYHYTRSVGELPFIESEAEDLVALFVARKALAPLAGTPLHKTLSHSFQRLTRSMQGRVTFQWTDIDQAFSVKDSGVALPDIRLFDKLARAVIECRQISFKYTNLGSKKEVHRSVQPYHIAEVDGGWYLIGHDLTRKAKRTFALQRIKVLNVLTTRFARPADFSLSEHLGDSFSVWRKPDHQRQTYKIHLRLRGWAAIFVSERRWHPSQVIKPVSKSSSSEIDAYFSLGSLEEITRWVLSWGGQCTVLAPPELKQIVQDELARAIGSYEE